eukprot:5755427-Prymnesium_polylepis.1
MDPNALVVGVEANTRLVMMLTEIEKPGQPTSYVGWLQSNTSAHAKISVLVREMKASSLAIKGESASHTHHQCSGGPRR